MLGNKNGNRNLRIGSAIAMTCCLGVLGVVRAENPQEPPRKSSRATSSVKGEQVTLAEFSSSGVRKGTVVVEKVNKQGKEWKKQLTPMAYAVTRLKQTEYPFSGKYNKHYEDGIYRCVSCGAALFSSKTKYDSGSGWPSFWDLLAKENIEVKTDLSDGMVRDEVSCKRCGAHLGHVFPDGPAPTNLRYCVNSAALDFEKAGKPASATEPLSGFE